MSVTVAISELDSTNIMPKQAIKASDFSNLIAMINALYESLLNTTVNGASSQTYRGHDHGEEGGVPIINNCQISLDQGYYSIYEKSDFSASSQVLSTPWLGKYYISPKLAQKGQTFFEIAVCYRAIISSFNVSANNGEVVEAQVTGESDVAWIYLQAPITTDTDWVDLYLKIETSGSSSKESASFFIHSVQVVETYRSSQPQIGFRALQTARSKQTFLRYFETLDNILVSDDYPLSADLFKRVFSALNALAECTLDTPTVGATTQIQAVIGHDHASNLGRSIGHGKVYSAGSDLETYKTGGTATAIWECTPDTTWTYIDAGLPTAYRRTNNTPNSSTTPLFQAYISHGITSTETTSIGATPTTYPYIEGWVFVSFSSTTANVKLKIYNQTRGSYSKTITISTTRIWSYIRYIPCSGDTWNDYDIQVQYDSSSSGDTVAINAIVLSEAYKYDSNYGAYKGSSGSIIAGSPRSGVRKVKS